MTAPDTADPLAGLTPIDGGWHVKDLPNGRCVDVLPMIYNYRVVRSDQHHTGYDRGWCYQGTGPATLLTATTAALAWDGADNTEPGGNWIKRAI